MAQELAAVQLRDYAPPLVTFDCHRCKRRKDVLISELREEFGNLPLGEIARRVAAKLPRRCQLAYAGEGCGVRVFEPAVEQWAYLAHAREGRWLGRQRCQRHHAALKSTKPCPEVLILDPDNLIAVFGWDFPLERLPRKMRCHKCGCELVSIEWIVPDSPADPNGTAAVPFVRFRPTRIDLARKHLAVIDGGSAERAPKRPAKRST